LQHPSTREKSYKYKGQFKTKKYVAPGEKKPIKVSQFAKGAALLERRSFREALSSCAGELVC
jgi:hypothetical protein